MKIRLYLFLLYAGFGAVLILNLLILGKFINVTDLQDIAFQILN